MRAFPSNKIMLPIILLITIGFGLKFMIKGYLQFFQLNYDWHEESLLRDYGNVHIDSVSYNFVSINGADFQPDVQKTYKLIRGNTPYYFRSTSIRKHGDQIKFNGIEWVTDQPSNISGTYRIQTVNLPLKKNDGPSVITLSDCFLIGAEAKYYRRDLSQLLPLQFKGSLNDVFNFPYDGRKNADLDGLLQIAESISVADNYIVMFGNNQNQINPQKFKQKTEAILAALKAKHPQNIILITLPPSYDRQIDQRHKKLNTYFREVVKKEKIKMIDSYHLLNENPDEYSRNHGKEISRDGYYELAKKTAEFLK